MPGDKVEDWLLEPKEPSVRYLALTQLLGRPESDPEVRDARSRIGTSGWASEVLQRRNPGGWWEREKPRMEPRFLGTNWTMLALSDLGASRTNPEVRASCEFWMANSPLQGGGVGGLGNGKGHHCYTAGMARALIRFGYDDDPRLRKTLEFLVRTSHPKGGWTCRWNRDAPAPSRTLDAWEGLSAFAAYPRSKWSPAMQDCVERAAEYYLERELYLQGDRYEPWFRFHWPTHYYYDLLVGLDVLTALGYGDDQRLRFALDHLKSKRRSDGRWILDADQTDPDPEGARWFAEHPTKRPTPLSFETVGRPSKMITLRARTVLSRAS